MEDKYRSSSNKDVKRRNRVRSRPDSGVAEPLNHEQERIQKWLKQVRFKKTTFGGVNEADVWKKIAELNTLYEAALSAERARYDALLAERTGLMKQNYFMDSAEHGRVGDEDHQQ